MLSDAQVERWSRQIVVPEIGPRGQARLLASAVAVRVPGAVGARIADLLRRAGARVTDDPRAADAIVTVPQDGAAGARTGVPTAVVRLAGPVTSLAMLPSGWCGTCNPAGGPAAAAAEDPLARCGAHAVAALAAAETVLALVDGTRAGRRFILDLARGDLRAEPLAPCAHHGRTP